MSASHFLFFIVVESLFFPNKKISVMVNLLSVQIPCQQIINIIIILTTNNHNNYICVCYFLYCSVATCCLYKLYFGTGNSESFQIGQEVESQQGRQFQPKNVAESSVGHQSFCSAEQSGMHW